VRKREIECLQGNHRRKLRNVAEPTQQEGNTPQPEANTPRAEADAPSNEDETFEHITRYTDKHTHKQTNTHTHTPQAHIYISHTAPGAMMKRATPLWFVCLFTQTIELFGLSEEKDERERVKRVDEMSPVSLSLSFCLFC
jgi:hypothetical protein